MWVGVPLALIYWEFVIHLACALRGGTAVRFPANSSHMCRVELALDRLLFSSKGFLKRTFSSFINPMAVPRWVGPNKGEKAVCSCHCP